MLPSLLTGRELKELEKLEQLLNDWGVDWVLVGAYALRIQGYKVKKKGHLNVLVDKTCHGWMKKTVHEAFPPRGSRYFDEYFEFVENVARLHFIPYSPEQLKGIFFMYELPSKRKIKVGKPAESVKVFGEEIKQHNKKAIGEYKVREWLKKIKEWKAVARKKGDKEFEKTCEKTICEVEVRFNLK